MATNYEYEKPQVKVFQSFTEVPTATVGNQPVLVFGPSYQLYRYANNDEHDLTQVKPTPVWYGSLSANYPVKGNVDQTWVRVFAEGALVNVGVAKVVSVPAADIDIGDYYKDPDAPYVIIEGWGDDDAGVEVGDYLYTGSVDASGVLLDKARVLAIYENKDATTAETYPYVAKLDTSANTFGMQVSGVPTESEQVKVGVMMTSVEFPDTSDTRANSKGVGWETTTTGITIDASTATVDYPRAAEGVATVDEISGLFIQCRTRRTDLAKSIESIGNISSVSILGDIDPANPLAYGVYMAKLNSGNCPVYYIATTGEDKAAFEAALRKASLTEDIYSLCPMTQDQEILDLVEAHVNEMSDPEMKRWRIGWVSATMDDHRDVLPGKRVTVDAGSKKATFVTATGSVDTTVEAIDLLSPQDIIVTNAGDEYVIDHVVDNQTVILEEAVADGLTQSIIKYVRHTYTGSERAEVIAAKSRHFADRRMYNVFPATLHQTVDGVEVEVSGCFGAAAVAGLCSSTLPQQPLTNMAVNGITDVPETYQNFSNEELNVMAAGGTFIIAQDLPYDKVYVRHQLSTATSEGNLLTRELSITKNVDSISYYLAETCDDLIGKYNITPELLRVVELRLQTAIDWLCNNTEGGLYGPQLLEEGTEIISVAEHPTLKDHVQAYIVLNPPKPFNVLEIYLTVI